MALNIFLTVLCWTGTVAAAYTLGRLGRKNRRRETPEEKKQREREARAMANFWSYDGTRQPPLE